MVDQVDDTELYVKIGDRISLYNEPENGYATVGGFSRIRVTFGFCGAADVAKADQPPPRDDFERGVFLVHTANSYGAQLALAQFFEDINMHPSMTQANLSRSASNLSASEHHRLRQLMKDAEHEKRNNQSTYERSLGQFIHYGQMVQLKHVRSNKFLEIDANEHAPNDEKAYCGKVTTGSEEAWFRVMPKFKVHQEGERVHFGDTVLLLNVTSSTHLTLNVYTRGAAGDALGEGVDDPDFKVPDVCGADDGNNTWKLQVYRPFSGLEAKDKFLDGGEFVRLYNREHNGFLVVETLPPMDGQAAQTHVQLVRAAKGSSVSSNSLFLVENSCNSMGKPVNWKASLRLKHLGTGLYLARSSAVDDGEGAVGVPVLTNKRDESSDLRLDPLYDAEGPVPWSSAFFLAHRHHDRDAFLNVQTDVWHSAVQDIGMGGAGGGGKPGEGPRNHKMSFIAKARDENVFVLRRVPQDVVDDMNVTKGVLSAMQLYARDFMNGRRPGFRTTSRCEQVLRDLISFVLPDSSDHNPLTRDGIPRKARQDVMREQNLIEAVFSVLSSPFDEKARPAPVLTLRQIKADPANKKFFHIACLCYRLVKHFVKDNLDNAKVVAPYISFMQGQLGYQLKTADTLMELFTDNAWLLERLEESHVMVFLDMIKGVGKLSRYMNFLNALVTCSGKGVPRNQRLVCDLLLVRFPAESLIRCALVKEKVCVSCVVRGDKEEWVTLEEFVRVAKEEQCNYFERQITCLANCCVGRNTACRKVVAQMFPFELCFKAVTNHAVRGRAFPIRSAFLNLLRSVYIDVEPNVDLCHPSDIHVWAELDKGAELPAVAPAEATPNFAPLLAFFDDFLLKCKYQVISDVHKNQLVVSVVEAIRDLLRFGYYASEKDVEKLIPSLINVLDGKDDRLSEDQEDELPAEMRYEMNPQNKVMMEAKLVVLDIMEIIADLRAQVRHGRLLLMFRDWYAKGEASKEPSSRSRSRVLHSVRSLHFRADKPQRYSEPKEITKLLKGMTVPAKQYVPILRDLTNYQHPRLMSAAYAQLIRYYKQRRNAVAVLRGTNLLVSEERVKSYRLVEAQRAELAKLIFEGMSAEQEARVRDIIKGLTTLCIDSDVPGQPNFANQEILENLDVHRLVLKCLELPFSNDLPREQGRREIFLASYVFLKEFARRNTANQALLLPSVDFFMSQMGAKLKAADTITEIFRDNRQVCSQIEERTVRHFVNIIAEAGRFPRYLRFFQILVAPEGKPLKRNQDMIFKAMLERQNKTFVLFNGADGMSERKALVDANEHLNDAEGLLNYHLTLVSLMAGFVAGKNQHTEAKCVELLPIEDVVVHIARPELDVGMKVPFVWFLNEAYVTTFTRAKRVKSTRQVALDKEFALSDLLWDHLMPALVQGLDAVQAGEGQRKSSPEQVATDADEFVVAVSALLGDFFEHLVSEDLQLSSAAQTTLRQLLERIAKAFPSLAVPASQRKVQESLERVTLAVLNNSFILIKDEVRTMTAPVTRAVLSRSTGAAAMHTISEEEQQEERIRQALPAFAEEIAEKMGLDGGPHDELRQLVSLFESNEPQGDQLVRKLVSLMTDTKLKMTTRQKSNRLEILEALAYVDNDGGNDPQIRLNNLGATNMVVKMICDEGDSDVLPAVFALGIALLQGGDETVQATLIACWNNDEMADNFFKCIHDLMVVAVAEVKDRQQHFRRVAEIREAMEGELEADIEKALPEFREQSCPHKIMRFLQLCCEGHNRASQDYLREQTISGGYLKSFDIVSACINYAVEVEAHLADYNVDRLLQALDLLVEVCQGPCPGNQRVLALSKVPLMCSRLLLRDPECELEQVVELKDKAALVLLSLLEGCRTPFIPNCILNDLDVDFVRSFVEDLHDGTAFAQYPKDDSQDMRDAVDALAGDLFSLLCNLSFHSDRVKESLEAMEPKARARFEQSIGSIEINQDGLLTRVLFPIPPICANLTEKSRDKLLWSVDRSSQSKKLEDFVDQVDDLEFEMLHQETIKERFPKLFALRQYDSQLELGAFWLAVFINFLILVSYGLDDSDEIHGATGAVVFIYLFGVVLVVLNFVNFGLFLVQFASLIVRKSLKAVQPSTWMHALTRGRLMEQFRAEAADSKLVAQRYYMLAAYFVVTNGSFLFQTAQLVFSLLGLFHNPFFFSFQLLMMAQLAVELQNVALAVTTNWKSLVLTGAFGFVIVYIFGIIGFSNFRDHYVDDDDNELCRSLFQCTIVTMNGGLRKGDVGEILSPTDDVAVEWGSGALVFFQFLYFVVIITILLNIIFGIIIDTFGELRANKHDTEEDIRSRCFICGIESYDFDRYGDDGGYVKHIAKDHNMWQYVFFIIHLHVKDETEYNGPESYVNNLIHQGEVSFFPINQAIVLLDFKERQAMADTRLRSQVEETNKEVKALALQVEKLQELVLASRPNA